MKKCKLFGIAAIAIMSLCIITLEQFNPESKLAAIGFAVSLLASGTSAMWYAILHEEAAIQ